MKDKINIYIYIYIKLKKWQKTYSVNLSNQQPESWDQNNPIEINLFFYKTQFPINLMLKDKIKI